MIFIIIKFIGQYRERRSSTAIIVVIIVIRILHTVCARLLYTASAHWADISHDIVSRTLCDLSDVYFHT